MGFSGVRNILMILDLIFGNYLQNGIGQRNFFTPKEAIKNEIMKKENIETTWESLDWEEIVNSLHQAIQS